MGLPLFVVPDEEDAAARATEKTASVPRSAIRRYRTLRGSQAQTASATRRRRMLLPWESMTAAERESLNRSRSPRVNSDDNVPSVATLNATANRLFNEEEARLNHLMSFERQHRPNPDVDGPYMPPVPEPRDYSSAEERRREVRRSFMTRVGPDPTLRRMARRHAPTPPWTSRIGSDSPRISSSSPRQSSSEDMITESRRHVQALLDSMSHDPSISASYERHRLDISEPHNERRESQRTLDPEMNRRLLVRQARRDNGLGDRDRSLSPDRGHIWDTLLTSITPDPQPPSASSSFASSSAAAAAISSSDSQPASSSTSITTLGSAQSPPNRDCDSVSLISSSDSESDDGDRHSSREHNRSDDTSWRTYAEVVNSRGVSRDIVGRLNPEHRHRIILRLAANSGVPEWLTDAEHNRQRESASQDIPSGR